MRDLLLTLAKRLPFILPLFALAFFLMAKAGGGSGVVVFFSLGVMCLAVIAILIARPVAEFLSLPFGDLYMPRTEVIPPPLYFVAEKYEKEQRWEEAAREYAKILHYHPKEFMAHAGRIRIAAQAFQDWDLATDYCLKARKALQGTAFEPELERVWFELQENR